MARGVNKVILVGNLGADPEKRTTPSGTTVTTLSVATTRSWRDKQTGEKREHTEWHRVKMFGRLAEVAADYLSKGRQVYIEGSIRTDKVQGNDGQTRYFTDIIADDMQMLGGREGEGGRGSGGGYASGGSQGGGYRPASPQSAPAMDEPQGNFDEDDIPF